MLITEDFLHYVWKFRLFERAGLITTDGQELEVFSAGLHNHHAGPDFSNARIRIGDTTWAGNVELHISSADWQRHGHTGDGAYENVILHVVYTDDAPVIMPDGRRLPTLALRDRISPDLYARYHKLIFGEQQFIPCEASIARVDELTMSNWLSRILIERLEKKSTIVTDTLTHNRGDWEETFYQFLAAGFGFKTNALPFELLARSLPQIILAKHKNNPLQIEALIFGQAGMLAGDFTDDYPRQLKQEYLYLQHKHGLKPVEGHLWKFMRMRPQNFPTIRLAQFAALVIQSNHLFSKVLELKEADALRRLFTEIKVNDYWQNHYRFDAESKPATKSLGAASVDGLLMNSLALVLFAYGRQHKQSHYINRAIKLLESLPAENNHITAEFVNLGLRIKTAFDSQALLELKNNYCDYKKCLDCGVGNKILKLA